jgi:hypothetical protein
VRPAEFGTKVQFVKADAAAPAADPESRNNHRSRPARSRRKNLVQKMRDWLRRAA